MIKGDGDIGSRAQRCLIFGKTDANAGARSGRLDDQGIFQPLLHRRHDCRRIAQPFVPFQEEAIQYGQVCFTQDRLGHPFVIGQGRSQHPTTDVRDIGELQQTLQAAILAVAAMQGRESHIHPLHARSTETPRQRLDNQAVLPRLWGKQHGSYLSLLPPIFCFEICDFAQRRALIKIATAVDVNGQDGVSPFFESVHDLLRGYDRNIMLDAAAAEEYADAVTIFPCHAPSRPL